MDKKREICEYLKRNHSGRGKAVHSAELERLFSMGGRSIRRIVSELRKDGCPICSDEGGYYYARTQSEINDTTRWLNDFVSGVCDARSGLVFAVPDKPAEPFIEVTLRIPVLKREVCHED